MEITLGVVRSLLREALGFDSFTAGFIRSVAADKRARTACINDKGDVLYNPDFVSEHVKTREDLFCLVFHELLHPFFRHYAYGGGKLENLACDAVINAAISEVFPKPSGKGSLFRRLYRKEGVEMILRPGCRPEHSRYEGIYRSLYAESWSKPEKITTGEMIRSLRILADGVSVEAILLLGSHGPGSDDRKEASGAEGLPAEVLERLASEVKGAIAGGKAAGYSESLSGMLLQALRTHLSLKRRMLRNFLTRQKADRFREPERHQARQSSPIPISPGKRDIVLLAAGVYPVYFRNRTSRLRDSRHRGLAIYLDVSGSVNEYLPKIIGILRRLKQEIETIFLFSNKVVETRFTDLVEKGQVETTYGTDFDCVAESILSCGFEKTVVVTDGYASLSSDNKEKLAQAGVKILTVAFEEDQECEDLAPFGPVLTLNEMVEAYGAAQS